MPKNLRPSVSSMAHELFERAATASAQSPALETDDLSRKVYGLMGVSLDALNFSGLFRMVERAAENEIPFLISTPNVNFLITSQTNAEFRDSILQSDLCLPDGMPLIWIAKLLGIPIRERIAGSDLFGRLKLAGEKSSPMKVFLLGGADGLAEAVSQKLNAEGCGLQCVGVLNPGFGSVDEMSSEFIIDSINTSQADLLAVFFSAQKAQAWLTKNHKRLSVPVRAQFGATINFEAGIVKRAPQFMRSTGFEWLWRIKEEPYLWRRYWSDGKALVKLMLTCVLPLLLEARFRRHESIKLKVEIERGAETCRVVISGDAVSQNIDEAIAHFRKAVKFEQPVVVDVSRVSDVDSRMFGLFLMLKKELAARDLPMLVSGASTKLQRIFRLNRFDFLLS